MNSFIPAWKAILAVMTITATLYLHVNGLWLDEGMLGQAVDVNFRGQHCVIRFPAIDGGFDEADEDDGDWLGGYIEADGHITQALVKSLRVDVYMPEPNATDIFHDDARDRATLERRALVWREASDLARGLIGSLNSWARAEGQSWLEPTPPAIVGSRLRTQEGQLRPTRYHD
ncbi:MAG TPA: hypothetical protein VFD59_05175 [Nocardioidaceae bacterium]|nr:hypothetical protein [Nocardioidaceae bacterium]